MKYFIYLINCLLIISIPLMIITGVEIDTSTINTTINTKKVNSLKLNAVHEETKKEIEPIEIEELKEEDNQQVEETKEVVQEEKELKEQQVNKKEEDLYNIDVLQTMVGSMSGYGRDCQGCRGSTSSGYKLDSIYYPDPTYGNIRILSGDKTLKFGSIVRVKNSKLGEFLGIVLDRGGSVGIGKKHLFDLLFSSEKEALTYEVSYNVTFEILRYEY